MRLKNLRKNRWAIIGLVAVVLVFLLAAFLQSKSPLAALRSTSDYKTYSDKDFGFSLKYPPEYTVIQKGKSEFAEKTITITSDPDAYGMMDGEFPGRGYTILVQSKPSFSEIENSAKEKYGYLEKLKIESGMISGHKYLRVNGVNKVATREFGKKLNPYKEDFVVIDNSKINIGIYPSTDTAYNRGEFNQILSSISF